VQQARRDAGLHVSDRISLTIQGSDEVFEATVTHRDLIVGETLATQFASGPVSANGSTPAAPVLPGAVDVVVGDNQPATILVVKR
jgi:isoleucyl-tRNA synthetase